MGYWSALFYEDQNTWTSAVADVCSTIVSYGVDIPWCVCSNSWNVINMATDYATFLFMLVSQCIALGCLVAIWIHCGHRSNPSQHPLLQDEVWKQLLQDCEHILLDAHHVDVDGLLPGGHCRRSNWACVWWKAVLPIAVRLESGVPGCEAYPLSIGQGPLRAWIQWRCQKKMTGLTKTLALYKNALSCESVFLLGSSSLWTAPVGAEPWSQHLACSFSHSWLCTRMSRSTMMPTLCLKMLAHKSRMEMSLPKVKAVEAKKAAEPAKKDEKKGRKPQLLLKRSKKPSGLEACINNTCSTVCRVACTVTKPVCDLVTFVYSKITSLPWENDFQLDPPV